MARLEYKDFMDKVKSLLGDRNDDEVLSFLQDCKDTITDDSDAGKYKTMYEEQLEANKKLDAEWRTKFTDAFYSSDTNINTNNNPNDNTTKDPNFDIRSEEEKKAETIKIDDLFTVVNE